MFFRKLLKSYSRRSTPSSRMRPSSGSYSRASSFTSVVFPAPFSPTSATRSSGSNVKVKCRTAQRSEPGQRNPTSWNSNPRRMGTRTGPAPEEGRQIQELHLLRHLGRRAGVAEVVEQPPLRCPLEEQRIAQRRIAGLAQERRHDGDHEQ